MWVGSPRTIRRSSDRRENSACSSTAQMLYLHCQWSSRMLFPQNTFYNKPVSFIFYTVQFWGKLLYQHPYTFQNFKRAKKKTLCVLKRARDHLANDYRLHSPSFFYRSFTNKTIKPGSEPHRQEISKNEADAYIIWNIREQSHGSRDFLVPFLVYTPSFPHLCNVEIMMPSS